MRVLAITTSSSRAGIALFDGDAKLFSSENLEPRTHSEWLHHSLATGLKTVGWLAQNLNGIAVDIGPGSFTGIRVGFSSAKTFSFALGIPVFQATSLEVLLSSQKKPSVAMINAFKNKVYFLQNIFDQPSSDDELLSAKASSLEPKVLSLESAEIFLRENSTIQVLGNAIGSYPSLAAILAQQGRAAPTEISPSAEQLGKIAIHSPKSQWILDWKILKPLYLRDSEAEENARA